MSKPIKSITSDFEQIILLITAARNRVYSNANAELVMLYFNVGQIVSEKVANGKWGDGTVNDLASYIAERQPLLKGFNRRGLYRMRQFYEVYSNKEIVTTLMTQISWTNQLLILAKTKTSEEKLFYLNQCLSERLSKRELERQLNSYASVRVFTNWNY